MIGIGVLVALLWTMSHAPARTDKESADELVLFCATALLKPAREVAADYEKEYGVKIRIEPDSSGALLTKLRVAPDRVDLYLPAEESFMRSARQQKLVAEVIPVARQHVVIAVAPGNPRKIARVEDLLRDGVRVVLPNPELAAVSKSAQRALAGTGRWEALLERRKSSAAVSFAGNVNEAAQAVKIGAADATVVWDATAKEFAIEPIEAPEFQARAIEQAVVCIVTASRSPMAALRFARYLTARDRGQVTIEKNYFHPIDDADVWEDRPELTLMSGAMLKPGVDDLLKRFSEREGVSINTIYAGCGIHVAQMKAMKGGQAAAATHFPDAYFACDVSFMSQVQQWFETAKRISRNDIVLVVPKGNPNKVQSINDLTRLELRVGLAHPKNSALGALVDDMLKKLNLHDKVYDPARKLPIVHSDAGHALVNQMVTGALDLIVVYRSNVLSNPENAEKKLDIVEMKLPEAVAIQPYAVAKDSRHKYLMRRLLEAILAPESQKQFVKSGFQWIAEGETP